MRKQNSSYSKSASSRSQHRSPLAYQTLLKRRNDTIPAPQLYERPLTHSAIIEHSPSASLRPPVDIRDYVKQMGNKSQCKVTSKSPEATRHCQPAPNEDECLSRKSSRSVRSNLSSYSAAAAELKPLAVKTVRTVEELEGRIENLVRQTMEILQKQRSNIGLAKWASVRKASEAEADFGQIQACLQELAHQIEENGSPDQAEKLSDLNHKIELVEKLMASECTESEVLRQQYFSWKNQRTNTTSFSNKKLLNDVARFNRDIRGLGARKDLEPPAKPREAVTRFDSTSKLSYRKPQREYYLGPKQKQNSYSLNRQPMQRSSYSAQYLNYGHIPTYSHKPDSLTQAGASLAVKASTYQQQYKQKLALSTTINIKDLDCCRDKFKHPNVSFINTSKKTPPAQVISKSPSRILSKEGQILAKSSSQVFGAYEGSGHKENFQLLRSKRSEPSLIPCMSMTTSGDFFKSEHTHQFSLMGTLGNESLRNPDIFLKSQIKDKKLLRMKEAFKARAMQR